MKQNPLLPQWSPSGDLDGPNEANEAEDRYMELNPSQKASIERGLADADSGRTMTSEEMWKRYGRSKKG